MTGEVYTDWRRHRLLQLLQINHDLRQWIEIGEDLPWLMSDPSWVSIARETRLHNISSTSSIFTLSGLWNRTASAIFLMEWHARVMRLFAVRRRREDDDDYYHDNCIVPCVWRCLCPIQDIPPKRQESPPSHTKTRPCHLPTGGPKHHNNYQQGRVYNQSIEEVSFSYVLVGRERECSFLLWIAWEAGCGCI